jgi:plasmid stabilization system protein ParE
MPQYKIIISFDAENDIFRALDYYHNINPKLASKFENEIESFFDILERTTYFSTRYENYRAVPLDIFPYLIIFQIDEDLFEVEIKALFHTSQNHQKYPR